MHRWIYKPITAAAISVAFMAAPAVASATPPTIVSGPDVATTWFHADHGQYHASWLCDLNSVVVGAGFNRTLQEVGFDTAPELFGGIAALAYLHGCDEVFHTNPQAMAGLPWNHGHPTCINARLHVPYHARLQRHLSRVCLA